MYIEQGGTKLRVDGGGGGDGSVIITAFGASGSQTDLCYRSVLNASLVRQFVRHLCTVRNTNKLHFPSSGTARENNAVYGLPLSEIRNRLRRNLEGVLGWGLEGFCL
jgi:hypothetical protein